ncbi:MAG: potassium channel family protein [Thermodesulfobacteriota bacterium]
MKAIWNRWIKNPFALPLTVMAVILAAGAAGFAFLEAGMQSEQVGFFEGLWWSTVTLFTVGYGDLAPKTVPGRILGMVVMAGGIGLVSTITGAMASAMVERRARKRRGLLPVTSQGHVLILGWNNHGSILVERLRSRPEYARAQFVLAADMDPAAFERVADTLGLEDDLLFVRGNLSHKAVLERAGAAKARIAYILASEEASPDDADNSSVLVALTFRSLAPRTPLYAEALREQNRENMLRAGVTRVLGQEELAAKALAFMSSHPVMHGLLVTLLTGASGGGGILHYRELTDEEKSMRWPELVRSCLEEGGKLPVAACGMPREFDLNDLLDASQAIDSYVMELFRAAGRDAPLGRQSTRLSVNPSPDADLSSFDGIIYMDQGA